MSSEIPAIFSVVVIRNKSAERTDDTISVSRDGQYYNVRYFSKEDGVKHHVSMTGNDLYKYFKNLLTMLAADDEPFSHVQFNFPATPAVMYRTENLNQVYEVVMDQFDQMLANWPLKIVSA
jgi:hypothetical protein